MLEKTPRPAIASTLNSPQYSKFLPSKNEGLPPSFLLGGLVRVKYAPPTLCVFACYGGPAESCAFGGAPRCTAHRAVQFAAFFFVSPLFARKPIAPAIASTLNSPQYSKFLPSKMRGYSPHFAWWTCGELNSGLTRFKRGHYTFSPWSVSPKSSPRTNSYSGIPPKFIARRGRSAALQRSLLDNALSAAVGLRGRTGLKV